MKPMQIAIRTVALGLLFAGAVAQAQVTGTVTNKTTGKPSVGDSVVLVDVQAGMGEVAKTTTDARGHYALRKPGASNYLVKAMHQGAGYFIAAPEGGAAGDISVYDVATKVTGVFCEADVMEIETVNGQLRVIERYFVHNTSNPPTAQWSAHTFDIVLPAEALLEGAAAQRPGGLPTSLSLDPDGPKGHYSYNFPIQPDNGEKSTLFQLSYTVPYSGKYTIKPMMTLPTQSVGVLLPKSITFAAGAGSVFQPVQEDPGIQTFVAKNAVPGKALEFTVSGTGSMPRENQGAQAGQQGGGAMGAQDSGDQTADAGAPKGPGGGMSNPINTPDPLSKYKWWILGGLALLLAAAAAFLLRKPAPGVVAGTGAVAAPAFVSPAVGNSALLNALKEEIFALESDKIAGTVTPADYAELKAALETVLKRALNRR
jgi:hypothetical protein